MGELLAFCCASPVHISFYPKFTVKSESMVRLHLVALDMIKLLSFSVLVCKREQSKGNKPDRFVVIKKENAFHTFTTQPSTQYAYHVVRLLRT